MKEDAPDHPKMKRLRRLLKIPLPYANGIMERLWNFTGRYEPDGGIGRKSDDEIAEACAMPDDTDTSVFVAALVEAGFLDKVPACRLFVHDWPQHCTHYTHNKIARQKAFFADGSKPSLRRLDARYKPEAEKFYGVCAQTVELGAHGTELGAHGTELGAHGESVVDVFSNTLGAQTGQLGAHGKAVRARALPTPKPTPKPTPTPKTAHAVGGGDFTSEQQQQHCALDSIAVAGALRKYGTISKSSVGRFISACMNGTGYSEMQIIGAIQATAESFGPGVQNPIGLLITQVPSTLPEFVAAERLPKRPARGTHAEREWEMAEAVLQNPESRQEDIQWAQKITGKTQTQK